MNPTQVQRWRAFLDADPTSFTDDELEDFVGDAVSAEWKGGPVEALVPDVCEEFRAVSKRLGRLHGSNPIGYAKAWNATRALFKAGCAFGDALERLEEAATDEDKRAAHAEARGVWAVVACFAGDES